MGRVGNGGRAPVPVGSTGQIGEIGKTHRIDGTPAIKERSKGQFVEDNHDDRDICLSIRERDALRLGGSDDSLNRGSGQEQDRHDENRRRQNRQVHPNRPNTKIGAATEPRQQHCSADQQRSRNPFEEFQDEQGERKYKQSDTRAWKPVTGAHDPVLE